MNKKVIFILVLTITTILSTSCSNSNDHKREADISNIDIKIEIGRFDKAFYSLDTNNIQQSSQALINEFPEMTNIYLQNVVNFGHPDSASTWNTYKMFKQNPQFDTVYSDALQQYSDVSSIEQQLSLAFRRGKYFFPAAPTPNIYMHVSGFNQSLIIGSDFISLSIDNYLGADYPIYKKAAGIHDYQAANMRPEKVVSDYLIGWITSEPEINPNKAINEQTLLDEIIYRGKIMYALSILLPDEESHILMGYTKEQWQWSIDNEPKMWGTLLVNNELFSQDMIKNGNYLNDGPFTIHFSQDSPARGGIFIGWQIVNSYMKNNQSVTSLQLMKEKSANEILQTSGYDPK